MMNGALISSFIINWFENTYKIAADKFENLSESTLEKILIFLVCSEIAFIFGTLIAYYETNISWKLIKYLNQEDCYKSEKGILYSSLPNKLSKLSIFSGLHNLTSKKYILFKTDEMEEAKTLDCITKQDKEKDPILYLNEENKYKISARFDKSEPIFKILVYIAIILIIYLVLFLKLPEFLSFIDMII